MGCLTWLPVDLFNHVHGDMDAPSPQAERSFRDRLALVRNDHTAQMIDNHIRSYFSFLKSHYVFNIISHICVAGGVLVSAASGYWKSPILAFGASAWGLLGISLRNLSDFSKKESLRNLTLASHYLEKEGVKGFSMDPYMTFSDDEWKEKNKE